MKMSYRQRNGGERSRFAKKNSNPAALARRKGALERLRLNLKNPEITEKSEARILKEIMVLESR